jgi:hypothetical protein
MLDASDIGDDYRYANEVQMVGDDVRFTVGDTPLPCYRGALFELARPYFWSLNFLNPVARFRAGLPAANYNYYKFELRIGDSIERNRFFIYRHPLDETRQYFENTMGNVDEIASLSKQLAADFIVFVAPRFHHWNPLEAPDNWEADRYMWTSRSSPSTSASSRKKRSDATIRS